MTRKAALRGIVRAYRGPASAPEQKRVSPLSAPTILTTEGDWP